MLNGVVVATGDHPLTFIMKGGKRIGAGRPKGEPTTTISVRIKLNQAEELKSLINAWKNKNK